MNEKADQRSKESRVLLELFEQLGIVGMDEIDAVAVTALDSGYVDSTRLRGLLTDLMQNNLRSKVDEELRGIYRSMRWDPAFRPADGIAYIRRVNEEGPVLRILETHSMAMLAEELGDAGLSRSILDNCIRRQRESETRFERGSIEKLVRNHPGLDQGFAAELQRIEDEQNPPLTLAEVIESLSEHDGWSEDQLAVLDRSTARDYADLLKALPYNKLQRLIGEHILWARENRFDSAPFARAFLAWHEGAKQVIEGDPRSRLAEILEREVTTERVDKAVEQATAALGRVA